ncbi:hypothetical protein TTHERM_00494759 (macronuclear) [Tetrahymena thermophila SB210]|uniref:Uncharacterized protein n=1 Tax=Tetrahymena thermophila (strain SB210) TaxID=312017 RepID=A4VD26_TETTS|nr:hypothetical protein TTHERM_00494759 [Tetrahymena thermophila SB210]EDK31433.1 hypothetical protein TTHERM_00494759 [Tetrahymena thermophila SB210]|eukprot:XP_001470983.1 hypothetical protein TTHERM_00494759 [Tetrahymena thermophila SB210]
MSSINVKKINISYNNNLYQIAQIPKSLGCLFELIHKQILKTNELHQIQIKQENNKVIENEYQYISLIYDSIDQLNLIINAFPITLKPIQKSQDTFKIKSQNQQSLNKNQQQIINSPSFLKNIFYKFI